MIKNVIDYHSIGRLKRLVEHARNIVVTCHLSPDGDAIGSALAMCRMLRNMGKRADVVLPDQVPHHLAFIAEEEVTPVVYSVNRVKAQNLVDRSILVICLDFNTFRRIDKLADVMMQSRADKVLIDHHEDPDLQPFAVAISHPEMSSTCELLYRVFLQAGWLAHVDRFVARCLYLGMMTDTGNFAYDNSNNPELYEIVAQLLRYDINKTELHKRAIDNFQLNALRLQGYAVYQKMEVDLERGAALIVLSREDLQRFGYRKGDTEGLVNRPLSVPQVRWSVFMREDEEYIKVSMRAEGDFRVDEMCTRYFGGGGHEHAAGGDFRGTLDEAVAIYQQILSQVEPINQVNNEKITAQQ